VARRFLASHEGAWDDGDENLVRGYLDRWLREGDDPVAGAARGRSAAALARAGSRRTNGPSVRRGGSGR
jgi:hypothetical protein